MYCSAIPNQFYVLIGFQIKNEKLIHKYGLESGSLSTPTLSLLENSKIQSPYPKQPMSPLHFKILCCLCTRYYFMISDIEEKILLVVYEERHKFMLEIHSCIHSYSGGG